MQQVLALPGASSHDPAWQALQPAATDMLAAPADMRTASDGSAMMGSLPSHTALASNAVKHTAATNPVPLSTGALQSPQQQATAVSVPRGPTHPPAFAVAKGLAVPGPGMTPLSDVLAATSQPSVHAALRGYVEHGAHKRAKQC